MTRHQFQRYYYTLRHMKAKQIFFRIYYLLRGKVRKKIGYRYPLAKESKSQKLHLVPSVPSSNAFAQDSCKYHFTFLNQKHTFQKRIDWNFSDFGKLWTYNLNYFDYLHQAVCNRDHAKQLIYDFIHNLDQVRDGMEPFPIALRGMNWIKFLSKHNIQESKIDDALYAQYDILMDNLEYHLLGNHLLENGFSLLFGAYYFGDQKLFKKAHQILTQELQEQILTDGAHFELAPMYHQIMLYRVLDCYNLIKNNHVFQSQKLEALLYTKASIMLGWLDAIRYQCGKVPHFNDSTEGIAPNLQSLFSYAKRLGITYQVSTLGESGYRKFVTNSYELVVDVGNIGPDYIPGHAHSDTFNFELYIANDPWVIDTGISTYEANTRRLFERSTKAHNTVMIDNVDQSHVWSSFRVAKRAKIVSLKEQENSVEATHNGYQDRGMFHTRQFRALSNFIEIKDLITIQQGRKSYEAIAFLHFAPHVRITIDQDNKLITQKALFSFQGLKRLEIVDIEIAKGYNRLVPSVGVKLYFERELITSIEVIV